MCKQHNHDVRYSIVSTSWERDDKPISIGDTFLAYANHKVTLTLRAADGWAFSPASVIMLDYEKCKVELCTGNTMIVSHTFYVVDEEDEADFQNWDAIVDDYAKLSTENTSDVIDDGGSFSFEIGENGGEPELQSIGLMSLSRGARLFAEPEELPAGTHDDGSIFGSIYLNEDFTSPNTIIKNNEKGLVIYVAKDVTLTNTAGKPCLELNGNTTITGPGRLTLVTSNEGTRLTGPAAIEVNGAKLKIENAALEVRGCKGIQGKSADGTDAKQAHICNTFTR